MNVVVGTQQCVVSVGRQRLNLSPGRGEQRSSGNFVRETEGKFAQVGQVEKAWPDVGQVWREVSRGLTGGLTKF